MGCGSGIRCLPNPRSVLWVYACGHHQGPISTVIHFIESLLPQVSSRHMQLRVNPGIIRALGDLPIFPFSRYCLLFPVLWLKKFRFCLLVVLHTVTRSNLGPKLRTQGRKNITGILPSTHTLFGMYRCPLFRSLLSEYCVSRAGPCMRACSFMTSRVHGPFPCSAKWRGRVPQYSVFWF